MNSKELMNRAWQYDIAGLLCFVLSNTSANDFGRICFLILGVMLIIGSLIAMLMSYKRSIQEDEARRAYLDAVLAKNNPKAKKASKTSHSKTVGEKKTKKMGKISSDKKKGNTRASVGKKER